MACTGDRVLGYRALQVRDFVFAYARQNGHAPSYREIRKGVGIGSLGEVSRIVAALERRGILARAGKGRCRRIALGGK